MRRHVSTSATTSGRHDHESLQARWRAKLDERLIEQAAAPVDGWTPRSKLRCCRGGRGANNAQRGGEGEAQGEGSAGGCASARRRTAVGCDAEAARRTRSPPEASKAARAGKGANPAAASIAPKGGHLRSESSMAHCASPAAASASRTARRLTDPDDNMVQLLESLKRQGARYQHRERRAT